MNEDRFEGAATRMGGEVKSGIGDAFGDSKLSGEGRLDQARGAAQNALGGVGDSVRDAFSNLSPGVRQSATKVGDFAKRNPVLAVLAMGAVASFVGKAMSRGRRNG